ncbi:MAG: hydrogenase nickel incorporation protein HypB [Acidobacteria bacterium]|nr:hydrogenase nickel incorporation protein HypB [Acidobacteriota bacterium]
MSVVTIERKVLEKNDAFAAMNRDALVRQGVFTINMVSSPGAGKTALLERTIAHLDGVLRLAVVEGDVQTDLDAQRVAKYGVPVVQIVTNGGCHLEARLVQDALSRLDLAGTDVLVIENVGNLVCPANFDLGEDLKVVVLSVTEGDDKPLKYPAMFQRASVLVINKVDLVPYVDADVAAIRRHARLANPDLQVFETSCRSGEGIAEWSEWLAAQAGRRRG